MSTVIIILIVQQNQFFDLYPAKILDLSAKSFILRKYKKLLIQSQTQDVSANF